MKATLVRCVTLGRWVKTHTRAQKRACVWLYNWSGRLGKECVNGRLPQQPMAAHRMQDIRCNNKGSVPPSTSLSPSPSSSSSSCLTPFTAPNLDLPSGKEKKRHSEHEREREREGRRKRKLAYTLRVPVGKNVPELQRLPSRSTSPVIILRPPLFLAPGRRIVEALSLSPSVGVCVSLSLKFAPDTFTPSQPRPLFKLRALVH